MYTKPNLCSSATKLLKLVYIPLNVSFLKTFVVNLSFYNNKFTTNVFRKDTFSGIYTNFSSFVALEHKFGLVYTLLHRSFTIVSDFSKFHFEVETLKKTLHKNAYPTNFVDKCISKFINNIFVQKPVVASVPKLELRIILPFLGNISSITKKRLNRCIGKRLKFCNLKIIFQTGNRLMNYFRFKDCIPETLQSNFVYKFKCGSCTASYYGKTLFSAKNLIKPLDSSAVNFKLFKLIRSILIIDYDKSLKKKKDLELIEISYF